MALCELTGTSLSCECSATLSITCHLSDYIKFNLIVIGDGMLFFVKLLVKE